MQTSVQLCVILSAVLSSVVADTPANCSYEDIRGKWTFYEGERSSESDINCANFSGAAIFTLQFDLLFPDVVVDEFGNKGFWTLIYNQGFEVAINYRKYFAFSKYEQDPYGNVTSFCDEVLPGWSHDVLGKNWACYTAKKQTAVAPKVNYEKHNKFIDNNFYKQSKYFIKAINAAQNSWRATAYPELNGMTLRDIERRSGGKKSRIPIRPKPAPVSPYIARLVEELPEEFDWRNVRGFNFVSPVRSQGGCGSCYSFASMAMLEARLRILTNNKVQVQLAPQDAVSCSEYSQGCEGGFPYLIAGKYAQDFGVVPEKCNPYTGKDGACVEKKCKRFYVADYHYVGGFYGACNEELMQLELVKNGPIAVSFEVYPDFQQYTGGIYHHTGLMDGFNPFMITNHVVLVVGYGVDQSSGEKHWIVKNSWGEEWGEDGYFRIRRGTNECSIESIAVAATPIP